MSFSAVGVFDIQRHILRSSQLQRSVSVPQAALPTPTTREAVQNESQESVLGQSPMANDEGPEGSSGKGDGRGRGRGRARGRGKRATGTEGTGSMESPKTPRGY